MLRGKKIVLGITGSIAAYKAATLVRLFVKSGAEVQVIMTPCAKEFITPLTLATLSTKPVLSEFFNERSGDWNSHVDLGLWADLFIVAPASANTIAKMAYGICDNLLLTTYLSMRCKTMVAPAMDLDMLSHEATQENIKKLQSRGNLIIEPTQGELASRLIGKGRMDEPESIFQKVLGYFLSQYPMKEKIIVTAGPTYEAIDPVRFIGNNSSGKMGFAIAEELASRNYNVTLITGPVHLTTSHPNIKRIDVVSAQEMYNKTIEQFVDSNAAILCAAVADYRPSEPSKQKIKRDDKNLTIELLPNKDIAKTLGETKKDDQILVGFALETDNAIENAKDKLKKKNLDFIVLNSLEEQGAGFVYDTNKITIIDSRGEVVHYDLKTKTQVAKDIAEKLVNYMS